MWKEYPEEMTYLYLARRVDGPVRGRDER